MFSVGQFMTDTVYTLQTTDNLHDVRELMELAKIRHVPITDKEGNFEGLITNRDLLACAVSKLAEIDGNLQTELESSIPVREIMHIDIVCVQEDTDIRDAANIMLGYKYGCLPVIEGRKLVGILTEADFIKITLKLLDN